MSDPSHHLEPNLFELKGSGSTIRYATSGMAGLPSLSFQSTGHDIHALGAEIRSSQTELGTTVSVDLETTRDGPTLTLSLVVPPVSLAGSTPCRVRTIAVFTTNDEPRPDRPLLGRQLRRYQPITLRGTASRVLF